MSLAEEIGYECELEENTSIDRIRENHQDGICIWVSGSGPSPSEEANYRIVMEVVGKGEKYYDSVCPGKTANQTMITGIIDAVNRVTQPMRLYIITATSLGFEKGLKGKGTNAVYLKELFDAVIAKKCQLTEVRWNNGSYDLKKYIISKNPNKEAAKAFENKQSEKQLRFKEFVYRECLEKVTEILSENNVDETIIRMVKAVKPTVDNE